MEKVDETKHIKRRTVLSTISLFLQSGYSALLGFVAHFVLTILFAPEVFGTYFLVTSFINVLNYFSDIGLAASLVQKKEVTREDESTTFTVQQMLILTILGISYFLTPVIHGYYKLPQEGIFLYWALLLSFLLSSLKTIPSIKLERSIQFQKIVYVQVIENTVFNILLIVFALMGMGLRSFTFAVILRSAIGLVSMYIISPWMPTLGISKKSLKTLVSFGAPFQANSLLALFKDDFITLFLGKVLSPTELGYIGWAKKYAEFPLRIIMDNMSRILFPFFSRFQHDMEKLAKYLERALHYQTLLVAPAIVGLALMMGRFLDIIPKYGKWEPALPLFYLFALAAFFSSYSSPFINALNALGKAKIPFFFMVLWTSITWILTPLLTKQFGMFGFPMTQVVLASTFFLVVITTRKQVKFNFFAPIIKPLIATMFMAGSVAVVNLITPISTISVLAAIAAGAVTYLSTLQFILKVQLVHEAKSLFAKS